MRQHKQRIMLQRVKFFHNQLFYVLLILQMLTNHANAYLYCKSIQNKSNTATIYQKITYISYDILPIRIKIQDLKTNILHFA